MISAEEARLLQKSNIRFEKYLIQIEEEIQNHCLNKDTGYIFHKISESENLHVPAIIEVLEHLGFNACLDSDAILKIDWTRKW